MVAVLEITALHSIALHSIALHCAALHCTAQHCVALYCTALHSTALHCTPLHTTALHCTPLHCGEVRLLLAQWLKERRCQYDNFFAKFGDFLTPNSIFFSSKFFRHNQQIKQPFLVLLQTLETDVKARIVPFLCLAPS